MVDAYVNEVDADTPVFKEIDLVLQFLPEGGGRGLQEEYETYETGGSATATPTRRRRTSTPWPTTCSRRTAWRSASPGSC